MSEEDTTQETPETEEVAEEPEAPESEPTEAEDQEVEEAAAFDAQQALTNVKKANAAAAKFRQKAKEAEERAKGLEPHKRDADLQRVARRLGLPDNEDVDNFLSRLQGESIDDLAQDAERLLSLMTGKQETKTTTTRPKERLRGGGDPDEEPEETDPAKLADRVIKARGY